jgi:hypothetical protein
MDAKKLQGKGKSVKADKALGKAIKYTLEQWPKLIRYIDDGHLSIDNNRAERAIKPLVIGRKILILCYSKWR